MPEHGQDLSAAFQRLFGRHHVSHVNLRAVTQPQCLYVLWERLLSARQLPADKGEPAVCLPLAFVYLLGDL